MESGSHLMKKRNPRLSDTATYPAIQIWRGISVLLVIGFHFDIKPLGWGFTGVDLFFVISGFVITTSLIRRGLLEGNFSFFEFVGRRVRRLVPALAVMLMLTLIVFSIVLNPLGRSADDSMLSGLLAAFGISNVMLAGQSGNYFAPESSLNPWLHTWSLGVEEQFYLGFALFLWALITRANFRPMVTITVATACLSTISFLVYSSSSFFHSQALLGGLTGFYSPIGRVWEFGIGVLAALAAPKIRERKYISSSKGRALGIWVATLLGVATLFGLSVSGQSQIPSENAMLLLLSLIVFCLHLLLTEAMRAHIVSTGKGNVASVFSWLGNASYSLYLWHWPVYVLFSSFAMSSAYTFLFSATTTLFLGWISRTFVEKPFLVIGGPVKRINSPLRIVFLASGLTVASFTLATQVQLAISANLAEIYTVSNPQQSRNLEVNCKADRNCSKLFLVGDSNAGQFREVLASTGEFDLVDLHVPGCPMFPESGLISRRDTQWVSDCSSALSHVIERISSSEEEGRIFFAIAPTYWQSDDYRPTASERDTTEIIRDGLRYWSVLAESTGKDLVVFEGLPVLSTKLQANDGEDWVFESCSTFRLLTSCQFQVSISSPPMQGFLSDFREAIFFERTSLAGGGLKSLNLDQRLCPGGICQAIIRQGEQNYLLYSDRNHLSDWGAFYVSEQLIEPLSASSSG